MRRRQIIQVGLLILVCFLVVRHDLVLGLFWDPNAATAAYIPGQWEAAPNVTVNFDKSGTATLTGSDAPPPFLAVLNSRSGRWKAWAQTLTLIGQDANGATEQKQYKYIITDGGASLVLWETSNKSFDEPRHANPDYRLKLIAH